METKILYHGTNKYFDTFENNYLCTKDSIDQYGSGFYFYSVASKTSMHGGLRVYAKVDINKSLEHDDQFTLTFDQVHSLICECTDLENVLSNFGDIDYEGFDEVLECAANQYCDIQFLDCLNMLGNDFFKHDCHILLNAFVKITGINCITDLSRDIYVILTKQSIEIIKVVNELEDN